MADRMFVGDLLPQLRLDVSTTTNGITSLVDFTTATTVVLNATLDGASLFSGRAATTKGNGFILMDWEATDTDTVGLVTVEAVATWTSKQHTFRASTAITIASRLA